MDVSIAQELRKEEDDTFDQTAPAADGKVVFIHMDVVLDVLVVDVLVYFIDVFAAGRCPRPLAGVCLAGVASLWLGSLSRHR